MNDSFIIHRPTKHAPNYCRGPWRCHIFLHLHIMYTSHIIVNTVYEMTAFLKLAMYSQGCRPSALPDFGIYERSMEYVDIFIYTKPNVFIHWCTSLRSSPPLTGWFIVAKITVTCWNYTIWAMNITNKFCCALHTGNPFQLMSTPLIVNAWWINILPLRLIDTQHL